MTNKIGEIINYGCYGKKAILVDDSPHHGVSIELPDCFNEVPVGFIAYIDEEGKIQVMEEDPHDYR